MYCHIHHCHYHHCNCVPTDSKEKGGALTQAELLTLTEEMKQELKDYTVDLKDQIFSYIDIGVNPVEIANTFASLKEQDNYILRTLTQKIDELNNTTNLSMYNLRTRVTSLEDQSATIIRDLADRTGRIEELEKSIKVLNSVDNLLTIKNPKDGMRVYVKSYHAGHYVGGGEFIYDSSRASENDNGTVINGWIRVDLNKPTLFDFGITLEEGVDVTENLRSFHTYCNKYNFPANYEGGFKSLTIQANARIAINTSVNFHGVPFILLGGLVPSGSPEEIYAHGTRSTFRVEDPDTPLMEFNDDLDSFYSGSNSHIPTYHIRDKWSGYGAAVVTSNDTFLPKRRATANGQSRPYTQAFHIVNGTAKKPLATTLATTNAVTKVRENSSRGFITLENLCLKDDASWNRIHFINISRNQVTLKGFKVIRTATLPEKERGVSRFISALYCSEFTLQDVSTEGILPFRSDSGAAEGTYVFAPTGVSNLKIHNINCPQGAGWGWIGSNIISDVHVTDSNMNRFDVHDSGFYITIERVKFNQFGIMLGFGGGDLIVRDCEAYDCGLIFISGDGTGYGGYWLGDIYVDNIVWSRYKSTGDISLIEWTAGAKYTFGNGDEKYPLMKSLQVSNINVKTSIWQSDVLLITLRSLGTTVLAPNTIKVNNVIAGDWVNLLCNLNIGNSYRNKLNENRNGNKANRSYVEFSNIKSGGFNLKTDSTTFGRDTEYEFKYKDIDVSKLGGVSHYSAFYIKKLTFHNVVNLRGARVEEERGSCLVDIRDCIFSRAEGSEGTSSIGHVKSSEGVYKDQKNNENVASENVTRIFNSIISRGSFRAWNAKTIQGLVLAGGGFDGPPNSTKKQWFHGYDYHLHWKENNPDPVTVPDPATQTTEPNQSQ